MGGCDVLCCWLLAEFQLEGKKVWAGGTELVEKKKSSGLELPHIL